MKSPARAGHFFCHCAIRDERLGFPRAEGEKVPIKFNSILAAADIDPRTVRLLRHQDRRTDPDRTPYRLWRDRPDDFMTYQSRQSISREKMLGRAKYWAVFVKTPANETLLTGLYDVGPSRPGDPSALSVSVTGATEGDDYVVFELSKSNTLAEYEGRLIIEWGSGALAWVQYAHRHDKNVRELRREFREEAFPGYLRFIRLLSEINTIPQAWIERLSEVKGVYVLTSVATRELYVGSATGGGGFYERWLQHAARGGDAVRFRSRDPSDYQVAILEIAGSNASENDIIRAEHLWMDKLRTNEMGLNGGLIPTAAVASGSLPRSVEVLS